MSKLKIKNSRKTKEDIITLGFSVKDLSKKLGVTDSYLSTVLNGKRNPSPSLAKKISLILDKELLEVFFLS